MQSRRGRERGGVGAHSGEEEVVSELGGDRSSMNQAMVTGGSEVGDELKGVSSRRPGSWDWA